jgi:myo-inositol catabolism protein IolC
MTDKEQIIEKLWVLAGDGQRKFIEDAYEAGALEARIPQAKWEALRDWLERSASEYEQGQMMSIAESIHGASAMREVLALMVKLDGPND